MDLNLPIDELLAEADAWVHKRQWRVAGRLLSALLEASSGTEHHALQAEILTRLGLIHRELGSQDQALAAFLLAHQLQPSDLLKEYIAQQQSGP